MTNQEEPERFELPFKNTLCFSPMVMVGTFSLEIILALYIMHRYGLKKLFNKLSVFLLFLLSIFQIAEFNICSGSLPEVWGRIGFVATALMPPVGLHLVSLITKKHSHIPFAYLFGLVFAGFFAFTSGSISNAVCGGNYVIFSTTHSSFHILYGMYYALFLLWGLYTALTAHANLNEKEVSTLKWIALGYTSFMLPAALSYIIFPFSRDGFASILCGFAIFMALILAFAVVPRYSKINNSEEK